MKVKERRQRPDHTSLIKAVEKCVAVRKNLCIFWPFKQPDVMLTF